MNEADTMLNELMDNERNWRRFVMLAAGLSRVWMRAGSNISSWHDLLPLVVVHQWTALKRQPQEW